MAQRNGAAVDVEFAQIQFQLAAHGQRLCALGFVDLETANLIQRHPGAFQQQANRRRRAYAHDLGRHAHHGAGHDARQRFLAVGPGPICHVLARRHDGRRSGIDQGRAVATGLHAALVHRLEPGQHFDRRNAGVRVLRHLRGLARQPDSTRFVAFEFEFFGDYRDDLARVKTRLLRGDRLGKGLRGEFVHLFTRDAVFLRQVLGGLDHVDAGRRVFERLPHVVLEADRCAELETGAVLERRNRVACHAFRAHHQHRRAGAGLDVLASLAKQFETSAADALRH